MNFIKQSMSILKRTLHLNHINSGDININRVIFQGDYLSPLIFGISIIVLASEPNMSKYGYKLSPIKLSHLIYMDELWIYGRNYSDLESLLKKYNV